MGTPLSPQDAEFVASIRPLFIKRALYNAGWIGGLVLAVFGQAPEAPAWLMIAGLIVAVACVVQWVIANFAIGAKAWERFFAVYGLENLAGQAPPFENPELSGVMGKLGIKRTAETAFHTMIGGQHVRLVELNVDFEKPRQGRTDAPTRGSYRVMEIRTPTYFHHVYIDSKRNHIPRIPTAMGLLHDSIRHNEQLRVEGDVNRYFNIYVPANTMSNGLITLTPDRLLALRDFGRAFDVEFVGQSIYIITKNRIRSPKDILMYQAGVINLLHDLGGSLRTNKPAADEELLVKPKPQNLFS